jgi:hypothetical protein
MSHGHKFWLELLFLMELLGSFAFITSDSVMNRSLMNTICAKAFKLAVTVSSDKFDVSFVRWRNELLNFLSKNGSANAESNACDVRSLVEHDDYAILPPEFGIRKTFDLEFLGWCCLYCRLSFQIEFNDVGCLRLLVLIFVFINKRKAEPGTLSSFELFRLFQCSPNLRIPKASNSCSPWLGSVCVIVKGSLS